MLLAHHCDYEGHVASVQLLDQRPPLRSDSYEALRREKVEEDAEGVVKQCHVKRQQLGVFASSFTSYARSSAKVPQEAQLDNGG